MTDRVADDAGPLVADLETDLTATIADVLADVAHEYARAVTDADNLEAAFSVSRVADLFTARAGRIVRPLVAAYEQGARWLATGMGGALPDGWDDLPGRMDNGTLPEPAETFVDGEQATLVDVGERMAQRAREVLAAGIERGDTPEQLEAAVLAAFAEDGGQLGEGRAQRIARTEVFRAWNTAALAAAGVLPDELRPVVKQWVTRHDARVRHAHADVDGQLRLLADPFDVDGVDMTGPHDPTAPPRLVANCRCVLAFAQARSDLGSEGETMPMTTGIQAALGDEFDGLKAAADGSHHAGAMIALMPTREDAERMAIDGGETPDDLHCTLAYLGQGADWNADQRAALVAAVTDAVTEGTMARGNLRANAFGANHWNPTSDSPSWVWAIGDPPPDQRDTDAPLLNDAWHAATDALRTAVSNGDIPEGLVPPPHSPWAAHVCAAYSDDPTLLPHLEERTGPVTFDRVRVTFAGEATDIPMNPDESTDVTAADPAALPAYTWSTPDDTAIAFENQETGDGRIFSSGALQWADGPWPLQYADEMLGGHEGAELAGAINAMNRDGDRIAATGVLYPDRWAGADAINLLQQNAPLGVSVDLDDVDVEFVDRRTPAESDDGPALVASMHWSTASVLRLDDGTWTVRATVPADWTASGAALLRTSQTVQWVTGPGGELPFDSLEFTLGSALKAAAGDPDDPARGEVVHAESSGEVLMRITRARVRGATLVAMPAYAQARIVLDMDPADDEDESPGDDTTEDVVADGSDMLARIIAYVGVSPSPVGAGHVCQVFDLSAAQARGYLSRAVTAGHLVRLAPNQYVSAATAQRMDGITADGGEGDEDSELVASAWSALKQAPPMPAAWFREPTADELPPGSGGVHYANGRVYGWVAQTGEPHAGFPGKRLTIESLGRLDLTHFLRQRFQLDDGSEVKAGAFTMNTGHHRDGAECETAACQFDDTRTVAAIVTVGQNDGGLWFSGAAAPWLSQWDANVFMACQPSYHMKQGRSGWQLRAVLSVPMPGHSSPLLAAAVDRSNLALTASAAAAVIADMEATMTTTADPDPVTASATAPDAALGEREAPGGPVDPAPSDGASAGAPGAPVDLGGLAAALVTGTSLVDDLLDAMERREQRRAEQAEARQAEIAELAAAFLPTPAPAPAPAPVTVTIPAPAPEPMSTQERASRIFAQLAAGKSAPITTGV